MPLKVTLSLEAVAQRCSIKNVFLKTPVLEFLFNEATGWRLAILLEKILRHRCFLVNFVNFLRTPFLQKTSG